MSYSFDPKDDVETQWKKWKDSGIEYQNIDVNELREKTIKELTYVSGMDVKEYTLYQKWCEVKERYPTHSSNRFAQTSSNGASNTPEFLVASTIRTEYSFSYFLKFISAFRWIDR